MLATHICKGGCATWASPCWWRCAQLNMGTSKLLEVEREIEGQKFLFCYTPFSAQLAWVQSLEYLIFSLDLPRASRLERAIKAAWKMAAETAEAAEVHAAAQSHLPGEWINIYRPTRTWVMGEGEIMFGIFHLRHGRTDTLWKESHQHG